MYFSLVLSIPFLTFQSPPPYFSFSLPPSNPTSFLLFYSTSSNITFLMSQSFLSTLFILSHSILFSSLPTLLPPNPLFLCLFLICLPLHYTPLPIFLTFHTSCFLSKSLIILLTSNLLLIMYCLYHLRIIGLHPSLSLSFIVLL